MKIAKEQIVKMADSLARRTFYELLRSNIDAPTALSCAKDAADAFGNALLRDLPEHSVEIASPVDRKEDLDRA
jgi:hypothetical protein